AAVRAGDVLQTPADLSRRVGLPVRTGARHLAAGQGLRYSGGAAARVVGLVVPARLAVPQRLEARELAVTPSVLGSGDLTRRRLCALGGVRGCGCRCGLG